MPEYNPHRDYLTAHNYQGDTMNNTAPVSLDDIYNDFPNAENLSDYNRQLFAQARAGHSLEWIYDRLAYAELSDISYELSRERERRDDESGWLDLLSRSVRALLREHKTFPGDFRDAREALLRIRDIERAFYLQTRA